MTTDEQGNRSCKKCFSCAEEDLSQRMGNETTRGYSWHEIRVTGRTGNHQSNATFLQTTLAHIEKVVHHIFFKRIKPLISKLVTSVPRAH